MAKLTMNYVMERKTSEQFEKIANYLNKQPGRYPVTPQDIAEEMDYFAVYRGLIEYGENEVVGIGDCHVSKSELTVYGDNLLIDPKYQGHVYGGSFVLTIFDAMRKNFKAAGVSPVKMISNVQAGNLRAGALYERIGYFTPEGQGTGIQNFFPFVYDYPIAKKFFDSQGIELVNCWKYYKPMYDEMLQSMKIKTYPYVFGSKEGYVRVILDTISERPILVEDKQILAACWIEAQEAYIDLNQKITWLLKNNSSEPLKVELNSHGNGGLKLVRNEEVLLAPGEGKYIVSTVKAEPMDEKEMNVIHTQIRLGDELIELQTGYRLKDIIQYSFDRDVSMPFRVGKSYTRNFKINNLYREPVQVQASFTDCQGVTYMSDKQFTLEILPGQSAQFPITFTADTAGVGALTYKLVLKTPDLLDNVAREIEKTVKIPINVLEFDQVLGWQNENGNILVMENEEFLVVMPLREGNGSFYIYDKTLKEEIAHFPEEELGPPFIPDFVLKTSPFFRVYSNVTFKDEGKQILRTELQHRYQSELFLVREIKMTTSNILTLDYRIENRGAEEITTGVLRKLHNLWKKDRCVLPLAKGLVHQEINGLDFPGTCYNVDFAENWMALENGERVFGVIWPEKGSRISCRKGYELPQIDLGLRTILPGSSVELPRVYFYYGSGSAKTVRTLYQRIGGKVLPLVERGMFDLNIGKKPLVLTQRKNSFFIQIDRMIDFIESRWINGTLMGEGPEGWQVMIDGDQLIIEIPEETVTGLYQAKVKFVSEYLVKEWPLQVWVTDCSNQQISVESVGDTENPLWKVDNGHLVLTMAPNFANRIISLTVKDAEYLCTTYPEAKAYHKESPWYGGIGCTFSIGELTKSEQYPAENTIDGVKWQGIGNSFKVAGWPKLNVQVEYLTLPGTPVLAIRTKIKNNSDRRITAVMNFDINMTNLQAAEQISAYFKEQDKIVQLKCKPEQEKLEKRFTTGWAAVETGKGNYLVLAHPGSDHAILIQNWGISGVHLRLKQDVFLAAEDQTEFMFYLHLEEHLEQAVELANLQRIIFKGESHDGSTI